MARAPRTSLLGLALALVLVAGCAAPPTGVPTAAPTREPGTILVTALLELSGPRAALGNAQRNALQLWSDQQRSRGSLRVRWSAADVAGSEARIVGELRRASEEHGADAVILGAPLVAYGDPLLRAIELARVPVLLTLPAPAPPVDGGRWLFALAPTPGTLDTLVATDLAVRGITQSATRLAPADAEAIRLPIQLEGVRALRLSGTPREYPLLAAVLKKVSPTPLAYFSYATDPNDLGEFKDLPATALWPGSRRVADAGADYGRSFLRLYAERHGLTPTWAATAYDALALVDGAAEAGAGAGRSTTALRSAIRDRLEASPATGVAATYVFGPATHVGPQGADLALLRLSGSAQITAR